jgi:Zn-dependent metalloprotease
MRRFAFIVSLALFVSCIAVAFSYLSPVSSAQDNKNKQFKKIDRLPGKRMAEDKAGIQRLKNKTNGLAEVKTSEATGAARFVNFAKGKKGELSSLNKSVNAKDKSINFFKEHGSLFGINNENVELRLDEEKDDLQGNKHQTFKQFYKGVPVFAGILKTHFDKEGQLNAVNGNAVPEIEVDITPAIDSQSAAEIAVALVADQKETKKLTAKNITLYLYRTGLVEGVPGNDYLAYEIEVTNGFDVREFVYVDAHSSKIVDQFTGIHDALNRRAFDGQGSPSSFPPNYPGNPFWVEGQLPFPTGVQEADNMIIASKETYDLFKNSFNRDNWTGLGTSFMDSIFNRGNACPNASWNGVFISFCPGYTTDDVTAHEWGHAYTQGTHNLIYAYQPGALNESYSDIWGETVDRLNDRDVIGNSGSDAPRSDNNVCTVYTPTPTELIINTPPSIAGTYASQYASFGPVLTTTGITGNVAIALDASDASGPSTTDACTPIINSTVVAGNIALVDRGTCNFSVKVYNAQQAGAVGVLIANNSASGLPGMGRGINADLVTIPSIGITQAEGNKIKAESGIGVNVTMRLITESKPRDNSSRWLMGEDVTPSGALRDMRKPTCYGNPGKVSDAEYSCDLYPGSDNGGVHSNSGVPNHAFALLVDGGTYNGQTIEAIGLTKAAHIYFRAMNIYQIRNSNFADHADSLEQSAVDLIASQTDLADLKTGAPSGLVITPSDLDQVKKAMLAVEMRKSPTQCGVRAILDKNTPADPVYTAGKKTVFSENFEAGATGWTANREGVAFDPTRNWGLVNNASGAIKIPARLGTAAYISDPNYTCNTSSTNYRNQSGVLNLDSPAIQIPNDVVRTRISFEHRIASEFGYDGGQLMVSVDGGAFTVVPDTAFVFNAYNNTLIGPTGSLNPRAGQKAFTGTDDMTNLLEASWGTSIVDLAGIAGAGQTVKFRWAFSNDDCGGASYYGWYVDNINVYGGWIDTDGDGITDAQDNCPNTNTSQLSIVLGTGKFSQTGVPNTILSTGCSLQQLIDASRVGASNHGAYVSRVSNLTDQWVAQGIITSAQKDAIMRAVAQQK